jgi:large subunit ribosomal protein L10
MDESPPDEANPPSPELFASVPDPNVNGGGDVSTSRRTADPRPEKVAVVDEVRARLSGSSAAILTEYRGLTVKDMATLRRGLRAVGGDYKVYKNTLVRFAVRDLGIDGLEELLSGPTAIAFVDTDAVGVAKALRDFARTNPALVVKGGVLGASVLSAADAGALAEIPPRDVLLARFAGLLAAPMQQFAGLLQAVPRNFAYGLKALIELGGAPGAPVSSEATPPSEVGVAAAESAATEAAGAPAPPAAEDAPVPTDPTPESPAAESPAAESPAAESPAAESAQSTEQEGA